MRSCPLCFKESNGHGLLKGDLAFGRMQAEVVALRAELKKLSILAAEDPDSNTLVLLQGEITQKGEELAALRAAADQFASIRISLESQVETGRLIEQALNATIQALRKNAKEAESITVSLRETLRNQSDRLVEQHRSILELKAELNQRRNNAPSPNFSGLSKGLKRKLLLLCHPDVNPQKQELATEMTQWILNQKEG